MTLSQKVMEYSKLLIIYALYYTKTRPITMGEDRLENSADEKYLGDQISEKGTAASITETIDKRAIGIDKKIKKIMAVAENICLMGMNSAMAAIIKFEQEIVTKL